MANILSGSDGWPHRLPPLSSVFGVTRAISFVVVCYLKWNALIIMMTAFGRPGAFSAVSHAAVRIGSCRKNRETAFFDSTIKIENHHWSVHRRLIGPVSNWCTEFVQSSTSNTHWTGQLPLNGCRTESSRPLKRRTIEMATIKCCENTNTLSRQRLPFAMQSQAQKWLILWKMG